MPKPFPALIMMWVCMTVLLWCHHWRVLCLKKGGTTLYHLQVWVPSVIKQYIATNTGVNEPCTWHTRSLLINLDSTVVGHSLYLALHHVGSSLHFPTQDGDTPLMIASQVGHPSVVKVLLQAGATINTTTQVRYRPFHAGYQDFVQHTTTYCVAALLCIVY